MNDGQDEEERLARLLGEIDELEQARSSLLKRIESARSMLMAAETRTGTIRASAELLCEHISDGVEATDEVAMLESEIGEVQRDVDQFGSAAAGLTFEAESFKETLDEADDELERLSAILIERRTKLSRGH
jgi:chromosome segregation ATPase